MLVKAHQDLLTAPNYLQSQANAWEEWWMIESTAVSFDMCRQRCFSSLSFLHFLPAFATVHSFREFNRRRVHHNLPTKCVHLTRGLIKKREGRVRGERGEGEGWLGGSGREQVQLHCRDPCDCTWNKGLNSPFLKFKVRGSIGATSPHERNMLPAIGEVGGWGVVTSVSCGDQKAAWKLHYIAVCCKLKKPED